LLLVVVLGFCTVFVVQIIRYTEKNKELEARKERLEQLLNSEILRKQQLEDEEAYIQTKKYIEERAKSIGYVYPDEIIFRKDD